MRLRDGRYECALCGAVLDVSAELKPYIVLKMASGRPAKRAIMVDGAEIHACPISTPTRRKVERKPDRATMLMAQGIVAEQVDCSLSDALMLIEARADDEGRNAGEIARDVVRRRISFR